VAVKVASGRTFPNSIVKSELGLASSSSTTWMIRQRSSASANGLLSQWNFSIRWQNRRAGTGDFVSTIAYIDDDRIALNYARTKKFAEFSKDELSYLAAKAKLPGKLLMDVANQTVERFYAIWRARKSELGLPERLVTLIDDHITHLPLFGGK
jgi:hypothetical protein